MIYICEGVSLDEYNNVISYRNGEICITEKEKRLLKLLLDKINSIVKKDEIVTAIWPERNGIVTENNILQLVFRLRKKLEVCGLKKCLCTVSREGYQFNVLPIPVPSEAVFGLTKSVRNGDASTDRTNKFILLFLLFSIIIWFCFLLTPVLSEMSQCEGNFIIYLSVKNEYKQINFYSKCLSDDISSF